MPALRFVLGDQLSRSLASLEELDRRSDVVLMVEVHEEATYVRHHPQKIALVLAAMRHFADALRREGIRVDYVRLDDAGNTGNFSAAVGRALQRHRCDRVIVTEPGEWRVRARMLRWEEELGVPVEICLDNRFLCSRDEFAIWAQGRKSLRMEYFYREMRRKTGWLMDGDRPVGGRWNYDEENRKALPADLALPRRLRFDPDAQTREVLELVASRYGDHFGELHPFTWAVTREDALRALEEFVAAALPGFGDYQDAMKSDADFLFHSLISPYLNIGLLDPREVCERALQAWRGEGAPLAAVEGFLRQILGWREFVRGLYWLLMPGYAESNFLDARRPLPEFFWSADTPMNCLRQTIDGTRRNAYAHHIQRLMVTGNFALLAGLEPAAVEAWYLQVYLDAFEWVELPNTHGMALFADGGVFASKPYAASGAYINRMSDYCRGCGFDPKVRAGPDACPFNFLYWHFLIRNERRLRGNSRMSLAYRNLDRLPDEQRDEMTAQAETFLSSLDSGSE
jgi:deoxyribodipyrimidine photolyase-related protein